MSDKICSLRPGMIKFMLVLVFIFNVIGWEGTKKIATDFPSLTENSKFSREEQLRRQNIAWNYTEDLVKIAQEKRACGQIYSPYDYFRDLKLIRLKEKELEVRNFNTHIEINKLQALIHESLKNGYTEKDIDRARENYKEFIDPARESREEAREHLHQIGLGGILNWFLCLYLKTLPLVFILYLLWAKEELGYREKFLIPKPFRFAVLLILYPIVIGFYIFRALKDNGRHVYAEAELRRTKKLFSYMSEEEFSRIKSFAKSNLSLSEWHRQLRESGLKPHHSFATALLVTLVFVFVIRPAEAGAKSVNRFAGKTETLEQIESANNLARSNITDEVIQQNNARSQNYADTKDMISSAACIKFFIVSILAQIRKIILPASNWFSEILHIPILAV